MTRAAAAGLLGCSRHALAPRALRGLLLALPLAGALPAAASGRAEPAALAATAKPWARQEWYFGWNGSGVDGGGVRGILDRAGVNPAHRLLHVGCGNSEVSESLWQSGFDDVTHLDLSSALISQLSARLSFTNHSFMVGDMTSLSFADGAFDVVLDKGALDFVYAKGLRSVREALHHVARVLKPSSGLYVMVSRFEPPQLLPSLNRMGEDGEPPVFRECQTQVHPLSPATQIGARYSYMCRDPTRRPAHGEL